MLFWCKKSFTAFGCSAYFPPLTNILFKLDFWRNTLFTFGFSTISANVSRLGEVADLEALTFNLALKFIRIPNVQFSTEPAILPNCC
jgi:hypothetical protein